EQPRGAAPDTSAAPALNSPATPSEDSRMDGQLRRRLITASIAVALLVAAVTGTILHRRSVTRGGADGTGAAAANAMNAKPYARMSEAEQLAFVREQEQRVSALMGDRPAKLNEDALRSIKMYVDRYVALTGSTSDKPRREDLRVIYARAVPHAPLIARSFAARKVPVVVGIYLPMIESAYRPCFESARGARGIFQFMPQTARQYGVARGEMCDVGKMAPAAAHYIADLMAELGEDAESMTLVLLSYNRGPEWVRDTLRELRDAPGYERNFWTLFAHRDRLDDVFRNENAGYVPMFFAAAIIGENPQVFGLQTPPLSVSTGTNPPANP
ncbi:MAG: transglycosylase SLT domain-containing protein, partial [Pyrinomonadaceae bacterium]